MAQPKIPKGKAIATAKVGEKGQIVVPKEIREMFSISPGDTLLLLADEERGVAMVKADDYLNFAGSIIDAIQNPKKEEGQP